MCYTPRQVVSHSDGIVYYALRLFACQPIILGQTMNWASAVWWLLASLRILSESPTLTKILRPMTTSAAGSAM